MFNLKYIYHLKLNSDGITTPSYFKRITTPMFYLITKNGDLISTGTKCRILAPKQGRLDPIFLWS